MLRTFIESNEMFSDMDDLPYITFVFDDEFPVVAVTFGQADSDWRDYVAIHFYPIEI